MPCRGSCYQSENRLAPVTSPLACCWVDIFRRRTERGRGGLAGGESIFNGKKFKDDKDGLKLKLDKRGVLAMGNTGKNSNSSQFFITLADVNRLTGNSHAG